MDGESFDRLSVVVHRLRDQATRRGALRVLLGGSLAAAAGLITGDAAARKNKHKHKNKCRGFGGRCNGSRDCCFGRCINGFCFNTGGGGGGGNRCNGRNCPNGWRCCRQSGVDVCTPTNFPTCCGNNSFSDGFRCCNAGGGACPIGWDCCEGFNKCCGPNQKCCGGFCISEPFDCDDFFLQQSRSSDVGAESAEHIPYSEPITVDDKDWISRDES